MGLNHFAVVVIKYFFHVAYVPYYCCLFNEYVGTSYFFTYRIIAAFLMNTYVGTSLKHLEANHS